MHAFEFLLMGLGLSMDAFAAAVGKGLSVRLYAFSQSVWCGLWFGGFQMLMPLLGYLLGLRFADAVHAAAPWIAFILLALIGGNMIRETLAGGSESVSASFSPRSMLPLAAATAIDAFAVGVTLAALGTDIALAVGCIGAVTFVISAAGVRIGSVFGEKYAEKAGLLGGAILILIGLRVLLENGNLF